MNAKIEAPILVHDPTRSGQSLFARIKAVWRADFLSPKDLVRRALVIAVAYFVVSAFGLREFTSILNGTMASVSLGWHTSAFLGAALHLFLSGLCLNYADDVNRRRNSAPVEKDREIILRRRIKALTWVFILGLAVAGATAIPLKWELDVLANFGGRCEFNWFPGALDKASPNGSESNGCAVSVFILRNGLVGVRAFRNCDCIHRRIA